MKRRRAVSKSTLILPDSRSIRVCEPSLWIPHAAHVDRLDLAWRRGADRLVIAFADQEIILDDAAEWRQRQDVGGDILVVLRLDREDQLGIDERYMQPVRPALMPGRLEGVFFDQVKNGNGAFMLHIGRGPADAVVQYHVAEPEIA